MSKQNAAHQNKVRANVTQAFTHFSDSLGHLTDAGIAPSAQLTAAVAAVDALVKSELAPVTE